MFGITVVLFLVIFILATVGLIRGPSKELGVTMAVVVLLAILIQFNRLVSPGDFAVRMSGLLSGMGVGSNDVLRQKTMVWFLYSSVVILTAFMAYHGHSTLAFGIKDPSGIAGAVLGGIVGALNGYFIGGTVWYYLDELDYPIQGYNWFVTQFSESAQTMVQFLPQNLFSPVILSALALGLLWWRILR
jgi:uncharacterized membrane protein required for colicin V production